MERPNPQDNSSKLVRDTEELKFKPRVKERRSTEEAKKLGLTMPETSKHSPEEWERARPRIFMMTETVESNEPCRRENAKTKVRRVEVLNAASGTAGCCPNICHSSSTL